MSQVPNPHDDFEAAIDAVFNGPSKPRADLLDTPAALVLIGYTDGRQSMTIRRRSCECLNPVPVYRRKVGL